eukprot:g1266.t1
MKYKSNTILLTIFVAVISSASVVQSLYDFKDGGAIQELTDANFNDKVFDSQQMWVVEFYAPWCGHCKALKPKFEEAAEALQKYNIQVGAMDADANKKTPGMFGVRGFPTLRAFTGEPVLNPYTKKYMRDSVQMNARSAKGIKNFAIKRMPNYVHAVNSSESLDTLKTRGTERELNSVIVLSKKDKPSPVIKGMSAKYMNRIEIGQANVETDSTLIEAISSEEGLEAPAIVVVKHNGEDSIVFDGDLKDADAIAKFIETHASEDVKKPYNAEPEEAKFEELNEATFKNKVGGPKDGWIIAYVHDEKIIKSDGWEEIMDGLKEAGGIRGAVVRCDTDAGKTLCDKEKIKEGEDTIKVYPYGKSSSESVTFEAKHKLKAMNRALSSIPNKMFNVPAMPNAVDQVLMGAAQTKRLALLYISDEGEPPAGLRTLSHEYNRYIAFNFIGSPDKSLLDRFQLKDTPAMRIMYAMPAEKKPGEDDNAAKATGPDGKPVPENLQFQMVPWSMEMNGQVQYGNAKQWIQQIINMIKPEGLPSDGIDDDGFDSAYSGANANAPVVELTKENFDKVCPKSNKLCVIALLDGKQSTKEKYEADIDTLQETKKKEHAMLSYSYLDGACQPAFLEKFGVNPANLPTAVLISRSKSKYANFFGTFTKSNLVSFVRGVKRGKRGTTAVDEIPELQDIDCKAMYAKEAEELASLDNDGIEMDDMMAEILAEEQREREEAAAALKAEKEAAKKAKEEAKKAKDEEDAKAKKEQKKKRKKRKKKKKKKKKKKN